MFSKLLPELGEYVKLGVYSSGIALASIGYIFNTHNNNDQDEQQNPTKLSILYQIYYPLLLQYPATLDLYYGLASNKNNNASYKLLLTTSCISSIIIPFFHSRIYFSNPDKYKTKRLLTQLFNPSNQRLMANAYFYTFTALSVSQIYSYFIAKYQHKTVVNTQLSLEKIIYIKCAVIVLGLIFDKFVDKLKSILSISQYNPPLIFNEINLFNTKHNYAMYILFDLDTSSLPLEIASLCIEFVTGAGFMTIQDANTSLSNIIYDCYHGHSVKVLYRLLSDDDTRFVDRLHTVINDYEPNDSYKWVQHKLAKLWVKNKMTPLYSAKPIYAALLGLTNTPRKLSHVKKLFILQ